VENSLASLKDYYSVLASRDSLSKSRNMEVGHRRSMAREKIAPPVSRVVQPRKGGGGHLAGTPLVINCRTTRATKGARERYQNIFSAEENEIMGRV
jgi:hypothetical protein